MYLYTPSFDCKSLVSLVSLFPNNPPLSLMKGGQKWLGLNVTNQFGYHCSTFLRAKEAEINRPQLFSLLFGAFSLFFIHITQLFTHFLFADMDMTMFVLRLLAV